MQCQYLYLNLFIALNVYQKWAWSKPILFNFVSLPFIHMSAVCLETLKNFLKQLSLPNH